MHLLGNMGKSVCLSPAFYYLLGGKRVEICWCRPYSSMGKCKKEQK